MVALWFSVASGPKVGCVPVVWLLKTKESDYRKDEAPFAIKITKVIRPHHTSPRIVAQAGWFTCHALDVVRNRFVALNRNKFYKDRIWYVEVDPEFVPRIQWELDRFGINHASMFPDLAGVCRRLAWKHCELDHTKATREPMT